MNNNDIMIKIIESIICIVILLVSRYLIPFVKNLHSNSKFKNFMDWVNVAVKAAEITLTSKSVDDEGNEIKTGPTKKAYVINVLQDILIKLNIKITDEQLDAIIESAVEDLKIETEKINK